MKGILRRYNNHKGFGYIQNEKGEDIIVPISDLKENIRLNKGKKIEYNIENNSGAIHVKKNI